MLLKNKGALPLRKEEKTLVVGELFEHMRYQGGGSSVELPFYDNVNATVIGARNLQKALLCALLTPWDLLKQYDHTRVLVLREEIKTLPWGEVWEEHLAKQGMMSDAEMFQDVREYEKDVLSKR